MGKGVKIGLSNLVYAIMTNDDSTSVTYQAPVAVPGIIMGKISPKSDSGTLYADDGPSETMSVLGDVDVEIETKYLDLDTQAAFLGATIVGGVMFQKSTDIAPYVAIGFKSKKTNGKYMYVWLYKGKFAIPEDEYKTQEEKPDFQTAKIKGTFIRRDYDLAWRKLTDEDHPNFVPATGTNWFTAVDGTLDTTPPTISTVVPANNATTVVVSTTVVWTFSEPIDTKNITDDNFMVFKDTDGSMVAGTLTYDSVNKKVTFTPSANLTAATAYRALVAKEVCDLSGNKMAANSVTKFTTA